MINKEYKRITKKSGYIKELDLTQELGYSYIYNRLAEIENKIENGTLVELPCKVGDTIYFDTYRRGESIGVQPHNVADVKVVVTTERPFGGVATEIYDWEFGKTVFLTCEEAEKALAERKEKW